MNDQHQTVPAEPALELAAQIVAEAATRDFHPTAAELKLQMLSQMPSFSEKELGFRKFIDFLNDAQTRGHLFVFTDNNGHPRVSKDPVVAQPPSTSPGAPDEPPARMRQDLWSALVHWEDRSDRFWDRKERRAVYVPVDGDGAPLWNSEPSRFARIAPVTRDEHLAWMHEFAESLEGPKRDALLQAAGPDAPRGALKNALRRHELSALWGAELQSRVTARAENWARVQGVRLDQIVERTPPPVHPAGLPSGAKNSLQPPSRPESSDSQAEPVGETALLRRRLHGVIDKMSLAELAAIQVPALYLLSE